MLFFFLVTWLHFQASLSDEWCMTKSSSGSHRRFLLISICLIIQIQLSSSFLLFAQGEVDQPYSGSQHPENRETFAGLGFRQQGQYTSVGPGQGLGQLRQGQGALQGAPEGRELFPGVREQGTEFREPLPGTGEPILSARGRDPTLAQRGLPPVQGELIAQREPIMGGREMLLGVRDPGANAEGRDRLSRPNEWVSWILIL